MSFPCPKCEKVLTSRNGLKKHVLNGCSSKNSNLKCSNCKKVYSTVIAITQHLETAHEFQQDLTLVEVETHQGN